MTNFVSIQNSMKRDYVLILGTAATRALRNKYFSMLGQYLPINDFN